MKTLFLSNMSKSRRLTSTFFPITILFPGYAIDYMHWQLQLSKRFRALKLWFVIRSFGVEGLQAHVREGVRLAKHFENLIRQDVRYDVSCHVTMRNDSLQFVTIRYISLQFVTFRYISSHYDPLRCVTTRYNSLHFVTIRYISLQFVTIRYKNLLKNNLQ